MVNVYCEHGAFRKELKSLVDNGQINLIMFPYENKNKKIKDMSLPSEAEWSDLKNVTWDSAPRPWDDYGGSEKYHAIQHLLGKQHEKDVKHIDAAYKSKCQCFLTRDKGDILSKKYELENLLGIKIYHPDDDWVLFLKFILQ
ncbi:MAG: hypothetical protein ACE5GN_05050 [Waddliaceae bacterium]